MHSSRNPSVEAERFAKEVFQTNSPHCLVLFGCGALHHIQSLYEIIQAQISNNTDCSKYILALEPLAEVLEDLEFQNESQNLKKLFWGLGIDIQFFYSLDRENYITLIEEWIQKHNNFAIPSNPDQKNRFSFNLHAFPFYKRNFGNQWLEIQDIFHQTFTKKSTNDNTIQTFAKLWTSNFFKNLQDFVKLNHLPILSPQDNDPPPSKSLLYIGAGANLEEQIEKIKKHRNEFFILSSDTAIQFLLKNELIPDGLISVDSGRGTFFHIPDTIPPEIKIFTWMGACRKLFSYKDQITLFLTTHPLDQALQQLLGLEDAFILKNPSLNLAGIAIALAEYWKFSTVYLSGFGLKAIHGKTHCRNTGYESFYLPKINRRNSFYSLYPRNVYGSSHSSKNKNSYEEIIQSRSFTKVFDFDQFNKEISTTKDADSPISTFPKLVSQNFIPPIRLFPALRAQDLIFLLDKIIPGTDRITLNKHLKT